MRGANFFKKFVPVGLVLLNLFRFFFDFFLEASPYKSLKTKVFFIDMAKKRQKRFLDLIYFWVGCWVGFWVFRVRLCDGWKNPK